MEIGTKLFFNEEQRGFLGKGRLELLKAIEEYGSISKAAKVLGMSYKKAWDNLDAMKSAAKEPLITTKIGGTGGGGSRLTPYAKELIQRFEVTEKIFQKLAKKLKSASSLQELEELASRIDPKISARNILEVTIVKFKKKNEDVVVYGDFKGKKIKAKITKEAYEELGLQEKEKVYFAFKAHAISPKGDNCLKAKLLQRIDNKRVKVAIEEQILYLHGKFSIKGYAIHFCIDPKDIIIIKGGI